MVGSYPLTIPYQVVLSPIKTLVDFDQDLSPFSGDSHYFWRDTPHVSKTG